MSQNTLPRIILGSAYTVVGLGFVLLFWFANQKAELQKSSANDNLSDIKISILELQLSTAEGKKKESIVHLNVLKIIERPLSDLVFVDKIIKEGNKEDKDRAEEGVELTEELLSSSELLGLPKQYPEEIFPVLFAQLQGRPLPKIFTPLQKRIVNAGNGNFEKMMAEVKVVIKEDIRSLETKQSTLREEISSIKRELESLRRKKK